MNWKPLLPFMANRAMQTGNDGVRTVSVLSNIFTPETSVSTMRFFAQI